MAASDGAAIAHLLLLFVALHGSGNAMTACRLCGYDHLTHWGPFFQCYDYDSSCIFPSSSPGHRFKITVLRGGSVKSIECGQDCQLIGALGIGCLFSRPLPP